MICVYTHEKHCPFSRKNCFKSYYKGKDKVIQISCEATLGVQCARMVVGCPESLE